MDMDQVIQQTKEDISHTLKKTLEESNTSIRSLAHSIGMQHPQVIRITSCENYTIDSLVKILEAAGLKLVVTEK